jgi:hypothetical protein
MELVKITHDGKPTLINGDHVISVAYEEEKQRLEIKLITGEALMLDGDDAVGAWTTFSAEAINDDSDSEDERDGLNADNEDEEEREPFERINHELDDLENQLKRNLTTRSWEARLLRDKTNEMDEYWGKKKRKEHAEELKRVKERANALAEEAEIQAHTNTINKCMTAQIINASSVKSILRDLDNSADELRLKDKLSDELSQKVRTAKERLAWHRAKKKLDESRVAEAGGSHIKGEKYKREAETLLEQDWTLIFPNEQPPQWELS